MTRLSQLEVENLMYDEGRARTIARLNEAEEKGRASSNPYALKLMTEFVLPLAAVVREEVTRPRPGVKLMHTVLLAELDPEVVAALAVRHVLNVLMQGQQNYRTLGYSLGRTIHRELVLGQFESADPDLYHTLARDFSRRMSKDERHRLTVFKLQAKKNGIELREWGVGSRDAIGIYLLGRLDALGMIEVGPLLTKERNKLEYRSVTFSQRVLDLVSQIRSYVEVTQPAFGPCVEQPRDWTSLTDGGWHGERMRRLYRYLVKTHPTARAALKDADLTTVLAAVNALQATRWRVNGRVLDTVLELAKGNRSIAEVETQVVPPKPERPACLDIEDKASLTPDQQAAIVTWKRAMVKWYEDRKRQTTGYGRFYAATRQAVTFRDYPELFFVYFLDSRGRAYPHTYGVNPQGSDLQKALLEFAQGEPLDSDAAVQHFLVTGANLYGVDDKPLEEREQWVREHDELILRLAADPVTYAAEWSQADAPLCFLAWCFEYAEWRRSPGTFLSRLPANKDGSCNGLQHFSAMLRDEVGGDATNLIPRPEKQDVYRRVAERAELALRKSKVADAITAAWQAHGIERSLAKRPVMTMPYGVTLRGATEYVILDYLNEGKGPAAIAQHDYRAASKVVMSFIWPAIGEVVVKAREAMDWLSSSGKAVAKHIKDDPDPVICWRTPSGFIAAQSYFRTDLYRIRTRLHGECRVRVAVENDTPHVVRHGNGLAPNFVHSMDSAHMHRVIARAKAEGIHAFSMIHDSYGVPARHTERLAQIIRDEFVAMYLEHDPLAELRDRYPFLKPPPEKGQLDIEQVRRSEFFFS